MASQKTTTDPAYFVVTNEEYDQKPRYPYVTDAMMALRPQNLADALRFVSYVMKTNRDMAFGQQGKPRYGEISNPGEYSRTLTGGKNSRYQKDIREVASQEGQTMHADGTVPKDFSIELSMPNTSELEPPVHLVRMNAYEELQQGVEGPEVKGVYARIEYPRQRMLKGNDGKPVPDSEDYDHEVLWSMASKEFVLALDKKQTPDKDERRDHALMCYALISHDCTVFRGTGSFARIVLQYLAQENGIELPHTKIGVNLNMKALCRRPADFVREYNEGQFTDTIASEEILEWHRQHCAAEPGASLLDARVEKMVHSLMMKNNWKSSDRLGFSELQVAMELPPAVIAALRERYQAAIKHPQGPGSAHITINDETLYHYQQTHTKTPGHP